MPQLSLYIDEKTLKSLETAAKIEHLSLSKYAVKILNDYMHAQWPDHYEELSGGIEDESFAAEKKMSFSEDSPREEL